MWGSDGEAWVEERRSARAVAQAVASGLRKRMKTTEWWRGSVNYGDRSGVDEGDNGVRR